MLKLTNYQRQYIIELLKQSKDLPYDYKHLPFLPERKEYKLVYARILQSRTCLAKRETT